VHQVGQQDIKKIRSVCSF